VQQSEGYAAEQSEAEPRRLETFTPGRARGRVKETISVYYHPTEAKRIYLLPTSNGTLGQMIPSQQGEWGDLVARIETFAYGDAEHG